MDGLSDMMGTQVGGALQVRDGPCDLEHPIVCPGRERQTGHGLSKNPGGRIVQGAPTPDLSGSHVAVRPHLGSTAKTSVLPLTSGRDAGPNRVARLRRTDRSQVFDCNGRHLDVQIDAVQQGTGIGIGEDRRSGPSPPTPPGMRVRTWRFGELRSVRREPGHTQLVEVRPWQGRVQGVVRGHVPPASREPSSSPGEVLAHTASPQLPVRCPSPFPLA